MIQFLLMASMLLEGVWGSSVMTVKDTLASFNEDRQVVLEDSIPQSFIDRLDYYYKSWHADKRIKLEYVDSLAMANTTGAIVCSDSLYLARLDSLQSAIPLSFNDIVRNYIELYTVKRRLQVANMLGLGEYYFPIFEEALDAECMPLELKYLPVIESALNPRALSRVGACGLWQFMYSTGKMYKLEINSFVDARRDPYLATQAAVRYLNDLYAIYEDWILVIAAYNCGPGNVNKAIRRSGGKKNYWDIYYNLPRETRGYVPAFIAANYVFNYYEEHGIQPLQQSLPPMCDSIMVADGLHFEQIAAKLDLSLEELRDLNPQYRADVIPGGFGKSYALRLPYEYVGGFIDNQDSIFACNRSKYFNDNDRTADPKARIKVHAPNLGQEGKARLVYTVKAGDVPGGIAMKFNVRLSDLKYWNNLNRRMTIRQGQKLVIYVPEKKLAQYKGKANYTGKVNNTASAPKAATIDGEYVVYTVKNGENLWTIAKKYPGVSNRDIMRWNGLSDADVRKIKPGQKLKIKI
ncbi:MAG: LysM peptidoglycan-binding domain-containing protein [Odoribacter sp.]|nr:LysM peptidoglycan-binding domain-containing protein [Odoribacter sp.]MDY3032579.1 LysM peptidoglycan-binding domain-containing protein [Odoribacter sp.]